MATDKVKRTASRLHLMWANRIPKRNVKTVCGLIISKPEVQHSWDISVASRGEPFLLETFRRWAYCKKCLPDRHMIKPKHDHLFALTAEPKP